MTQLGYLIIPLEICIVGIQWGYIQDVVIHTVLYSVVTKHVWVY